jgi:hypothetical protein
MKEIITYYGVDHQRRKFAEENLELQEAIIEYQNACRKMEGESSEYADRYLLGYRMHLIEEMADNFVLLGEFMKYFCITNEDIEKIARFKIARTHRKMEEEKKKNALFRES